VSWAGCANFGTGRDITKARAKAFILGSHFYSHKMDCVSQNRYFFSHTFSSPDRCYSKSGHSKSVTGIRYRWPLPVMPACSLPFSNLDHSRRAPHIL
jgi:hypothetical protein